MSGFSLLERSGDSSKCILETLMALDGSNRRDDEIYGSNFSYDLLGREAAGG